MATRSRLPITKADENETYRQLSIRQRRLLLRVAQMWLEAGRDDDPDDGQRVARAA